MRTFSGSCGASSSSSAKRQTAFPAKTNSSTPDIPWRLAIGMRNRAVHGHDAIDWEVVYETTMSDLPKLIEVLESLLPSTTDA